MQSTVQDFYQRAPAYQSLLPKSEKQPLEVFSSPLKASDEATATTRSHSRWASMPWKYEILSWIGSFCFFIAAITVLAVLNGRPVPALLFGLTPNALIGLLSTFGEMLLIVPVHSAIGQIKWLRSLQKRPMDDFRRIDEASRGPWGSVLLLARRKGGLTASFGAIVTIVALGISTFFQQALKYETVYQHSDDATMPIAQYMNGLGWESPFLSQYPIATIDPQLLAAPYVGLFSPVHTNFTALATAQCRTGNCTWESYQTLAVCSRCENLTSLLKTTQVNMSLPQLSLGNFSWSSDYHTLPNGFGLTGIHVDEDDGRYGWLNVTVAWDGPRPDQYNASISKDDWHSIAFHQNGSKLVSVFAVGAAPGTMPEQPNFEPGLNLNLTGDFFAPPIAFECILQFCVRTMRAELINSSMTETEISNWTNQTKASYSEGYSEGLVLRPPDSPTAFTVHYVALAWTRDLLKKIMTGSASGSSNFPVLKTPVYSSPTMQSFYMAMNSSTTGFQDLMENVANSLSLGLRNIPYQPPPVRGKAFSPVSHTVISWEWLALPLFELAASLVFLVAVMVETRRSGLVPWTNNPLAYFFHGLDERPHIQCERVTQNVMEDEARRLLIELQPHDDGTHLVIAK